MTEAAQAPAGPKPKKSVALSGVAAGNTALCTVGRTGNDLHYRGYDILDFADEATFEEIAFLLVHGHLPTIPELNAYKKKLQALRGLPSALKAALEKHGVKHEYYEGGGGAHDWATWRHLLGMKLLPELWR